MRTTSAILVSALLVSCGSGASDSGPSDAALISVARKAVSQRLRDPESAEFRNEKIGTYEGKRVVVCGEVNSKNGFGGMAGFQRYMSNGDAVTALESEMEGGDFGPVWAAMCGSPIAE